MESKFEHVAENQIARIIVFDNGSAELTIFFKKAVLHKQIYKTYAAAKQQQTRLLKYYKLI